MKNSRFLICSQAVLLTLLGSLVFEAPAFGTVTLLDSDWKIKLGGFIEFDSITDSTRSLLEAIGNTPVDRPGTYPGSNGRTQFSIRNSRFALSIEAPKINGTINNRAYFEFDFLGYDQNPSNTTGSVGTNEAAFFDNPTLRIRHAFYQASTDDWDVLVGQTWHIFGWQPYYFLNTVNVAPLPAMLYNREAQVRGVEKLHFKEADVQAVVGIMMPPQRDSGYPGLEAGVRAAYNGRKSGFNGGATGAQEAQPMSIGVSGTIREFDMPDAGGGVSDTTNYTGSAIAVDGLLPLLASPDGKSVGNTMTLVGEFTTGTGYGDQFASWTGNIANPLNTAKSGPASQFSGTDNLDGGIGDYDSSGAFHLVHLMTWNAQLQYNFTEASRTWMTLGHGELYSNNLINLQQANGFMTSGKVGYNREEVSFANVFHDLTKQIRVGVEYDYVRTSYLDGVVAHDNRYQISSWYMF
jgi:hypothetical protein